MSGHARELTLEADVVAIGADLHYLGRGHTDSDIVVLVDGVVFAGDLLENGAPPAFGDAFPLDWPDTAAALLELTDADEFVGRAVVPGHGPVADRAFAAGQHSRFGIKQQFALQLSRFGCGL